MSYTLAFTAHFKTGLERLTAEAHAILKRQVGQLLADPFSHNRNWAPLRNRRETFRMRIGLHVRALYEVRRLQRQVLLIAVGPREGFYRSMPGMSLLSKIEAEKVRRILLGPSSPRPADPAPPQPPAPLADRHIRRSAKVSAEPDGRLDVIIERMPWIAEEELYLLQIPEVHWTAILEAGGVEPLQSTNVPERWRLLIEDYWTNPATTQIGKIYSLGESGDIEAIALRPLSAFVLGLDPEQEEARRKLKESGPYLIKGSAGTGKTLVGLYQIHDLIQSRASESLLHTDRPRFGVITYTNTLADSNHELLRAITPQRVHRDINCTTLDKIAYDLSRKALGRIPNAIAIEAIRKWIEEHILPQTDNLTLGLIQSLGSDYVAEEIELVIIANNLSCEAEYLSFARQGRRRSLREIERKAVWRVHLSFLEVARIKNAHTFGQLRQIALQQLRTDRDYPRFSALFVDEAQDFSKVAKQLCLALVRDERFLILAADTAQSIYTTPISWRQVDERFDFRRRRPIVLMRGYRSTKAIAQAIRPLRVDPGDEEDRSDEAKAVFSGPSPRWISAPIANHATHVLKEISALIRDRRHPINAGQIAIIVRDHARSDHYVGLLMKAGIAAQSVDKNAPLEIVGRKVHIVTAHSSKGLGFPIVFVPEVSDDTYPARTMMARAKDAEQEEQIEDQERRLLYVALSRASHHLTMLTDETRPSRFLDDLNRSSDWAS